MYTPTLDEARDLSSRGGFSLIPICKEVYSDSRTPIEVMKALQNVSSRCFILESMEDSQTRGRYTFLGLEPLMELTCLNGTTVIRTAGKTHSVSTSPNEIIRSILKDRRSPHVPGLPLFTGGLVGYLSYDYIKYVEPSLVLDAHDEEHFKDVDLMLFDKVIVFDHLRQKILIVVNASTTDIGYSYTRAKSEIERLTEIVLRGESGQKQTGRLLSDFRILFDEEVFCSMVEKVKAHIVEGDVFQAVLSNRLDADFEGSLIDVYRVMRTTNPSPYMFYISGYDVEIAGASPETLVKLEEGILQTFPLAGTRPRGRTSEADSFLESELLADEKELAEHNMLVDLGRNDIGKVCKFGSVKVEDYLSIHRFSHVMHIGSTVKGAIYNKFDAMDALDAVLPAGTLSGAPKIRACEIINELENNKRGVYGGAIGYLGFNGNMDACIAIRIAYKKNDKIFIRSGAGIVADSVPANEYQECINKAKAVVNAIQIADGGGFQ